MTRHLAKPFAQAVDVAKAAHVLTVALLVCTRQRPALRGGQLLNAIKHARLRFVPLANRPRRNAAEQHLVQVIRIRVHEDWLARATGREIRHRRLGLHVLQRIHANAKMRQQRLRQYLAQRVINRRATRRHTVAAAITTQRTKERTVRRAGVNPMQTVDNVQPLLVRLQRLNRFRQLRLGQRTAALHASRNCRQRIKPLILHEENHPLGGPLLRSLRHTRQHRSRHGSSREALENITAIEHVFVHVVDNCRVRPHPSRTNLTLTNLKKKPDFS